MPELSHIELSHIELSHIELSHIDAQGRALMVDITQKPHSERRAVAQGRLVCLPATLELVLSGKTPKGAVIATAELAGIMAAKKTADLIPLCHPLALSQIKVTVTPDPALPGFQITAEAKLYGQTGVEMEALTAVSVAALTLYDMLKAVDKTMRIDGIYLAEKTGGNSDLKLGSDT
jgi:cyclic pyranopterin monophosphate synthase